MRAAMRVCSAARMQHTMRGRALMRMSLMVCLLTVAQGAWADRFLQEPGNFTAIVQGIDRIRFTLPTQLDDTQNEGIVEGVIYVSENGGEKREFLTWGLGEDGYNDLTSDSESGKITLRVTYDGEWQLVGKVQAVYNIRIERSGREDDAIYESETGFLYSAFDGKEMKYKLSIPGNGEEYNVYKSSSYDGSSVHWDRKGRYVSSVPSLSSMYTHIAGRYHFNMENVKQ